MKNTTNNFVSTISWNTKFYVLLAGLMVLFVFIKPVDETNILKGALVALFIVTVVDLLEVIYHKYTSVWKVIKIIFVLLLMLLIIIG